MEILLSILRYWKQILAVLLLVFAYWFGAHNTNKSWELKYAKEQAVWAQKTQAAQDQYEEQAKAITTKYLVQVQVLERKNATLKKELDDVKTQNDSRCTILNGTVGIHDRMSMSEDPATGTEGGSVFDATPSKVTLSQLLSVVGDNYTICHAEMKKLEALQQVVLEFQQKQKDASK